MNREETERKILDLVKQAANRIKAEPGQSESWVEFSVVHGWLIQGEKTWPGFHVEMTKEILLLGDPYGWYYVLTISQMLANMEAERDDIAEGVHFEHDGLKLQAVEVSWLEQLVRGNAT